MGAGKSHDSRGAFMQIRLNHPSLAFGATKCCFGVEIAPIKLSSRLDKCGTSVAYLRKKTERLPLNNQNMFVIYSWVGCWFHLSVGNVYNIHAYIFSLDPAVFDSVRSYIKTNTS